MRIPAKPMRCPRTFPNSLARLARLAAFVAALVAALCASACLESNDTGNYFRLEAEPFLLSYSRIAISLDDTAGRRLALLYDDTLPSLRRLERLPARRYAGETARILIEGYKGPRLAYREKRLYEGRTQRLLDLEIERFEDTLPRGPVPVNPQVQVQARPPVLASYPPDAEISIGDSVSLPAEAADADGDLASYLWDCGPGGPRDSAGILGYGAKIRFGARFADPGDRICLLRIRDMQGQSAETRVRVKVELDPPWADAGRDTTVTAGSLVLLHAGGEDGHGPVVSREWSIGGGPFRAVAQTETSIPAPAGPGDLLCILKVTDSDRLSGLDTLVVHVVDSVIP